MSFWTALPPTSRPKNSRRSETARPPARALDVLRESARALKAAGIEEPGKEAESIITFGAEISRLSLYRDNPSIQPEMLGEIRAMLARRVRREPLQYILGRVEFRGLSLTVAKGVLIPRPETELLIGELLEHAKSKEAPCVLDLCTGCGPLALSAARELPACRVYATDTSAAALFRARENARLNNIENVLFLKGSLYGPVRGRVFDVILSNPPYVESSEIDSLQPEIRLYEPRAALDGGPDGLEFYRKILRAAPAHLKPGGAVILEVGFGQAQRVSAIARASGLDVLTIRKDHAGIERVVVLGSQH